MGIRVLTVLGTRPEAIKLFPLIHTLEANPRFESRVCMTGQHRELCDQVMKMAGIVADYDLDLMKPSQRLDALAAAALSGIGAILDRERPDWAIVQGDTASAFVGGLAAYYRRIPVCHVEAGLRTGNIYHPWPEEAHRRMIASYATLHCAPTRAAADALIAEGLPSAQIHITGNTGIDALFWVRAHIAAKPELAAKARALADRANGRRILAVTLHRRENHGPPIESIGRALGQLALRDDLAIIIPLHPNPVVKTALRRHLGALPNVFLIEPLDYPNFAYLLDVAELVLTDSGGIQEEAPALGTPVLVMRETTERLEGVTAGSARLIGTETDRIVSTTSHLLDDSAALSKMQNAHHPFGDGAAAGRITTLLA